MRVRNFFYDKNLFASVEFSIPVIAVGNLSTGGTGKTPHIEYLIRLLQYQYNIATLSRGYKRKTKGFRQADADTNAFQIGDEPMQFYRNYPDTVVCVCEDRILGIPHLLNLNPAVDVVLLDDAFQHRSVKPGLNILITDFQSPYFEDYILPLGRLRESRKAASRADIIIVSKCPTNLDSGTMDKFKQAIHPLPHQQVYFSTIQYATPQHIFDKEVKARLGTDVSVILITGIAKPAFIQSYLADKVRDVHLLKYPDHHYYSSKDVEELQQVYNNHPAATKIILTTEKDASRLFLHMDILQSMELPIYTLPIEVVFVQDGQQFDHQLISYIDRERYEAQTAFDD